MKFWKLIFAVNALVFSVGTNAATIVDTGVISCDASQCGGATLSVVTNPDDMWAANFELQSSSVITDMQVWLSTTGLQGTSFTMALYSGSISSLDPFTGTIPDIANEIFSQDVFITDTGATDAFDNQWQGLSGLNLDLGAGSYWLSLELRGANDYDGYIPTGEFGALNPLGTYAFHHPANGGWVEDPSSDFAFQVGGTISAVPVPAAVWLFGSGLLGLAGIARRRSRA